MLFIPKSFMSPAGFRDHMFKTQLRTKSEYWPKTLQRENEGIYLRILKSMNKWGSKSKLDIQLSVPDGVACKKGHVLQPYVTSGGSCDKCGVNVSSGGNVFDCRSCNYYLCTNCNQQAKEYATNEKLIDQGIICKTKYGPYELSVPNRSVSILIFILPRY